MSSDLAWNNNNLAVSVAVNAEESQQGVG